MHYTNPNNEKNFMGRLKHNKINDKFLSLSQINWDDAITLSQAKDAIIRFALKTHSSQ